MLACIIFRASPLPAVGCGASVWNSDTVSMLCQERLLVVVDLKRRYRNSLNGCLFIWIQFHNEYSLYEYSFHNTFKQNAYFAILLIERNAFVATRSVLRQALKGWRNAYRLLCSWMGFRDAKKRYINVWSQFIALRHIILCICIGLYCTGEVGIPVLACICFKSKVALWLQRCCKCSWKIWNARQVRNSARCNFSFIVVTYFMLSSWILIQITFITRAKSYRNMKLRPSHTEIWNWGADSQPPGEDPIIFPTFQFFESQEEIVSFEPLFKGEFELQKRVDVDSIPWGKRYGRLESP